MKKKLLSILLVCALTISLCVIGGCAKSKETLPKVGQTIHGFQVTSRENLELLDCPTVTLEHIKSGATVYYIVSPDPNRTFDITFHTPALDDRGISHVFEHITISGSEKYPHQNIFFPAAYQTYNTFANAMTETTTTTFPVSSLSEDQLLKLMDFYLDGVFHPMLYDEPRLFQREAWRYDLQSPDAPITITGTVYNEMKGAIDISRAAAYNAQHTLFPGSIIGNNSGGDPMVIPTLTYQELLDFHDTYYHPSNALIFLYGELDLDRFLKAMDENYLSAYEKKEIVVPDGATEPLPAMATGRYEYPVEAGSDTAKGAEIHYTIAANGASREEKAILNVLSSLITSDSSPVMQAVQAVLPEAGFQATVNQDFPQAFIDFIATGVDEADADAFHTAIDKGLSQMAKGVDGDAARATVASAQFSLRSLTESGQIGPSLSSMIAYRWAEEGRTDYLNFYSAALNDMRDKADKGCFESVVAKYLVDNPHSALSVTVPVAGLKERQEAALTKALTDKKAAMSEEEVTALVRETSDFADWSAQEPPKALAESLKAVSVTDLPEELMNYEVVDRTENGVRYLSAAANVSGINFTSLELNLDSMPNEDLHWAALYASLVGRLGAGGHSAGEISTLMDRYLGGAYVFPSTLPVGRDAARPVLTMQWTGMDEDYETSLKLAGDLLFDTDLSDPAAIRGLVAQILQEERAGLNAIPDTVQSQRVLASLRPEKYGAYAYMTGLEYQRFLADVQAQLQHDPAVVATELRRVQHALATRTDATTLYAGSAESMTAQAKAIHAFWNALPETDAAPVGRGILPQSAAREGVVVDSAVQYNMVAATPENVGVDPSGKLSVLAALVNDQYLTPQMRQIVGAYGAAVTLNEDLLYLCTYRDPSLAEAYRIFEQTGAAVSGLELTQDVIDGYIMSAYSDAARPRGALAGATSAIIDHMAGKDTAWRLEELREMKTVTPADVRDIGAALTRVADSGIRSTFGGAAAIEGNRTLFDVVLYPGGGVAASLPRE